MPPPEEVVVDNAEDALAQIERLRAQIDTLMRETVAPAVANAAEQAEAAAGAVRTGAHRLAGTVRACPLISVVVALALGFAIGRASR